MILINLNDRKLCLWNSVRDCIYIVKELTADILLKNQLTNEPLSFYCPVKMDSLKPTEGGFVCNDCSKKVVDFRNVTKENFQQETLKEEAVCGIYHDFQLGKPYSENKRLSYFLKITALTTLLGFSSSLSAQLPKDTVTVNTKLAEVNPTDKGLSTIQDTLKNNQPFNGVAVINKDSPRVLSFSRRFPFISYRRRYLVAGYF